MSALPDPPLPATSVTGPDSSRPTATSGTVTPSPGAPALSAEHYAQLAAAHAAFAPIRRALRVSWFSAVTLALFAVINLPFALFTAKAAFAAVCLTVTAVFEFRGRAALGRLERRGVRILVWNQAALTAALTAYCGWSIATTWFGPDPYAEVVARSPEVGELLAPYADLFRQMTVGVYGIVLVVGWLFQALIIRYYATRTRPLETYLAQTPAWILAWNRP